MYEVLVYCYDKKCSAQLFFQGEDYKFLIDPHIYLIVIMCSYADITKVGFSDCCNCRLYS